MPETAKFPRQPGWRKAVSRAYQALDRRDPRELTVFGKLTDRLHLLTASGDDALIIADELGLPVCTKAPGDLSGATVAICTADVVRLKELPHRLHIVFDGKSAFHHEIYVCGRLLYTTTTDATAHSAANAPRKVYYAIDEKAATSIAHSDGHSPRPNSDTKEGKHRNEERDSGHCECWTR